MTGEMKVTDVRINEDGGATYSFDLDDTSMSLVQEEGLKLLLYCGLTKTDIQDVYDWILSRGTTPDKCVSCGTELPTERKSDWCSFCLEEE